LESILRHLKCLKIRALVFGNDGGINGYLFQECDKETVPESTHHPPGGNKGSFFFYSSAITISFLLNFKYFTEAFLFHATGVSFFFGN
jgi:hypothetical protein